MATLEVFFDISSPWTYLAFEGVQPMAAELGVPITWRPILVGGVFNAVNPSVYHSREHPVPAKQRYQSKDLADWADYAGLTIRHPPSVFPVNSVKAMRGCFFAEEQGALVPYARALFERYWGEDRDISSDEVLAEAVTSVGLDAERFFEAIGRQELKDALRANTGELIERGGFGSPTLFVNESDMYFGNDRLPLVRRALERALAR